MAWATLTEPGRTLRPPPPHAVSTSDRKTASRGLRLVQDDAEELADNPSRLRAVIRRAQTQLREDRSRLGSLRADMPRLVRLGRAIAGGNYRQLPWKSVAFVAAGLLYFVTPFDLIPDFIIGTGFLDDAVVVAYIMKAIRDDLARFEDWELSNEPADPETLNPPY